MSSLPGYTLESYVMWQHDLIVGGDASANTSLAIAEAIGTATRQRPDLTPDQFAPVLACYEPFRSQIEDRLSDFDEDNQSWRDYASYAFDFVPDEIWQKARRALPTILKDSP